MAPAVLGWMAGVRLLRSDRTGPGWPIAGSTVAVLLALFGVSLAVVAHVTRVDS